MSHTGGVPPKFRLRRRSDFKRVYAARRRRDGVLVSVHSVDNGLGHPRIGFSVSAKVGGAVKRNLVRRRLRVAARPPMDELPNALDVVIVARPEAAAASFSELDAELRSLIGKLIS